MQLHSVDYGALLESQFGGGEKEGGVGGTQGNDACNPHPCAPGPHADHPLVLDGAHLLPQHPECAVDARHSCGGGALCKTVYLSAILSVLSRFLESRARKAVLACTVTRETMAVAPDHRDSKWEVAHGCRH